MEKDQAFEMWWSSQYGGDRKPPDIVAEGFGAGWDACSKAAKEMIQVEEEEKIPFKQIIDRMNEIVGRQFKATPANKRFISARWRDGFRENDFERVCRTKAAQWKDDPAMTIYLRPETLFGSKMDSYVNEPEPKRKKIIKNHLGMDVEVDDE